MRYPTLVFFLPFLFLIGSGCSNQKTNPLIPPVNSGITDLVPVSNENPENSNHNLMGTWTLVFNPETKSISVYENRELNAHFNVQPYLPPPTFQIRSYNPLSGILDVDATIKNIFSMSGYDLRLIVFTDNLGSRLRNADDWTSLYDKPYGAQINPFKAYAKSESLRIFKGNNTQHTELLQLYFPSGFKMLDFAIDVSYPGNCPEPYEINNFRQSALQCETGSQALVEVDVYDWQDDIDNIYLWCPAVTGSSSLPFSKLDRNWWGMTVTNSTGTGEGRYIAVIMAVSNGISLYDVVEITVSNNPGYGGYDWVGSWGGIDDDYGHCIDIDSSGNVYVSGIFRDTVDFNPNDGIDEHSALNDWDIFMSKFTPDGEYVWTRTWGGPLLDDVSSIAIDNSDNIYVTGIFGHEIDLNPGSGTDYYHVVGEYACDSFLSKFNTNGDYIWGCKWGGEKNDFSYGLEFDINNHPVVTGSYWINADFDPGSGTLEKTSNGRMDCYMLILDENKQFVQVYTWGGAGQDRCNDIAIDASGNYFLVGDFENTVDLNPTGGVLSRTSNGVSDAFLISFNSNLEFITARSWGGSGVDVATCVEIDTDNNLYIGGTFENTVDFNPDAAILERTSNGESDVYLSKFDNTCMFLNVSNWGGTGEDTLGDLNTTSNRIFAAGAFSQTVDFDSSAGETWRTSNGLDDIYFTVLDSNLNLTGAYALGGSMNEHAYGIKHVSSGNIYITGGFSGFADFNPGYPVDSRISNGMNDAFLVKLKD